MLLILALVAATSASHKVDVIAPNERVETAIDRLYKPANRPQPAVRPPDSARAAERPASVESQKQPKGNLATSSVSKH